VQRYRTDLRELERFYDIESAPRRFARLAQFEARWRERLDEVDFEALPRAQKVDWLLLRGELEAEAAGRALARLRVEELALLLPFQADIVALEEARWRVEPTEPEAIAARLFAMAEAVDDLTARVRPLDDLEGNEESGDLFVSAVAGRRAAREVGRLRGTLRGWYESYAAFHPTFAWWVEQPHEALSGSLTAYASELREYVAGIKGEEDDPLIGDPLGREALERAIAAEHLAYSPEQLLAIGRREFAWCEARMLEASRELGFEDDWHAALEHVKGLHVPPGEQDLLVATQAREAIAWIDERELVTIDPLCRELWRVEMLSRESQRTLPFAAYGGLHMLVAYPTVDMDHATKVMSLEGNNEHFSRIVTPHELIPGHHLQGYMVQRHSTHRQLFGTPFSVEGWCLYWEMYLWDHGWGRGPEDRIGMLFWRMHRCARILVSLGFHLGELTPEQMIDFLVERVGHGRWTATAEVRRYVGDAYGPLYQAAYMIGGLQYRALARELCSPGGMSEREFHDATLRRGAIPIELLRLELREDLPVTRDWRPEWLFAGEVDAGRDESGPEPASTGSR